MNAEGEERKQGQDEEIRRREEKGIGSLGGEKRGARRLEKRTREGEKGTEKGQEGKHGEKDCDGDGDHEAWGGTREGQARGRRG